MASKAPTLEEQVFTSRHMNLTVTRFPKREQIHGDLKSEVAPGLRYHFGQESAVRGSDGDFVMQGGSIRVDDELRRRDEEYIEEYGEWCPPEVPLNKEQRKAYKEGTLEPEDAYLSTEEFLRKRSRETGQFHELPPVAPDAGEALRTVAELAIDRDTEGLVKLAEAESNEWARPAVLEAVEHALERLSPDEPEAA